jgi:hypothetical protein
LRATSLRPDVVNEASGTASAAATLSRSGVVGVTSSGSENFCAIHDIFNSTIRPQI